MSLTSQRDKQTAMETRLDRTDDSLRAALGRISALEVLCSHLKPKRPVREPTPMPGPSDPPRPRKNLKRAVAVANGKDEATGIEPNGRRLKGCAYCRKLMCTFANPKCDQMKRMMAVEDDSPAERLTKGRKG